MMSGSYPRPEAGEINKARQRLIGIARAAEVFALAGVVMAIGYGVYLWTNPRELAAHLMRHMPGSAIPPDDTAFVMAALIGLVPIGLFAWAMSQTYRLFKRLRLKGPFDAMVPALLSRLGWIAVALAAVEILSRTLIALILTSANPPGKKLLVFSFGSNEVASLLFGLVMFAFALIMKEALRIDEDNRSIV